VVEILVVFYNVVLELGDDVVVVIVELVVVNMGIAGSRAIDLIKDRKPLCDKRVYSAKKIPQRLVFKSPRGNSLVLSDEHNAGYFNITAELKSGSGKGLKLIDSPFVDSVILENEHGDRVMITSKPDAMGHNSINVEAKGSVNIISREGAINLQVVDGKEINITNTSTGSKRTGPNDPTPGNINITSQNNDVNVTVKSDTGAIYLQAKGDNGHIVLDSKGSVEVKGDKGVNIESAGDVKIKGSKIFLN
jgi:hypothetical protein